MNGFYGMSCGWPTQIPSLRGDAPDGNIIACNVFIEKESPGVQIASHCEVWISIKVFSTAFSMYGAKCSPVRILDILDAMVHLQLHHASSASSDGSFNVKVPSSGLGFGVGAHPYLDGKTMEKP